MKFIATKLPGAFIIESEANEDERGFFARTFCAREFGDTSLVSHFVQCSISHTRLRGTLRGLHYQCSPACEVKLVRCTAGKLHDVIVDLRPESPTYRHHLGVELSSKNQRALYVPEMFAHGFMTLEPDTEVLYQMSAFYAPELAAGVRYDDPKLDISWPGEVIALSERDRTWPLLS